MDGECWAVGVVGVMVSFRGVTRTRLRNFGNKRNGLSAHGCISSGIGVVCSALHPNTSANLRARRNGYRVVCIMDNATAFRCSSAIRRIQRKRIRCYPVGRTRCVRGLASRSLICLTVIPRRRWCP